MGVRVLDARLVFGTERELEAASSAALSFSPRPLPAIASLLPARSAGGARLGTHRPRHTLLAQGPVRRLPTWDRSTGLFGTLH